jgi:cystathionine beta-synthase
MKIHENILSTIGNTPMVKPQSITKDVAATVLAKVETFNPGNSIKDRMAIKMIEDAEKDGRLKPGGTIIEGTSGNTGMGLAIAAIIKGYKCIFTTTDKQSREKVDILRAFGAEVIVCPTNVDPEDPRSYYSPFPRAWERETQQLEGQPVRQPEQRKRTTKALGRRSGTRPVARWTTLWWAWAPAAPSAAPASS